MSIISAAVGLVILLSFNLTLIRWMLDNAEAVGTAIFHVGMIGGTCAVVTLVRSAIGLRLPALYRTPVLLTVLLIAGLAMTFVVVVYTPALNPVGPVPVRWEKLTFEDVQVGFGSRNFVVNMTICDTGTALSQLDLATVFYNEKPGTAYVDEPSCTFVNSTLYPGDSTEASITFPEGLEWSRDNHRHLNRHSNMTVTITILTVEGNAFPMNVTLP